MTTYSAAIDPLAGTHFTGKIFVTPHACDRAVEHFGIDRAKAPMYVMDMLRKAALIDPEVIDENGKLGRLFAYRRTAFVVSPHEDTVITLYPQHKANETVRNPIERLIQRALAAARRKEQRETKRINVKKAELGVERAECVLRLAKTDSAAVSEKMRDRITKIDGEIADLDREIIEIKRERTNIAKSVVAYV
ncbi:hypothetical protein [Paenibacillus naphthalenovorans]|uniref:hypothetical protein n=1 Tax=Paenibacillus naphthalenovorans TaxID=162209 RepID=UPI003D2E426E